MGIRLLKRLLNGMGMRMGSGMGIRLLKRLLNGMEMRLLNGMGSGMESEMGR